MKIPWLAACALVVATGAHATLADDTRVSSVEEAWAGAGVHYAKGRYAAAFGDFFWAAIRDHPQAQEMVGLMYLLGPATFGPQVRRDAGEAEFWLGQARLNGQDTAQYLACAITRKASEPDVGIAARALACTAGTSAAGRLPAAAAVRTESSQRPRGAR